MTDTQPVFTLMLELFCRWKRRHILEGCEYVTLPLGTIRTVAYSYNISGNTLMNDVPLMNDIFNMCANQVGVHFTIVDMGCTDYTTVGSGFFYKVACTKNILIEGNKDLLDVLSI